MSKPSWYVQVDATTREGAIAALRDAIHRIESGEDVRDSHPDYDLIIEFDPGKR